MSIQPLSKYVGEDYRQSLQVGNSPQMIDTEVPVLPVIEIQKGLPRANAKQRMRYTHFVSSTTQQSFQVATKSSTTRVFFLGFWAKNLTATGGIAFWDATSGSGLGLSANTAYSDENGYLFNISMAIGDFLQYNYLMPIEIKSGIRCTLGGTGAACTVTAIWIEELI